MSSRHTHFKDIWLDDENYSKWILKDPSNERNANCKWCLSTIQLGNMGKGALDKHAKRNKHKAREQACRQDSASVASMSSWLKPSSSQQASTSQEIQVATTQSSEHIQTNTSIESQLKLNDAVSKAEILWVLNTLLNHNSLSSANKSSALFSVMFPDSQIASKFTCAKTKSYYSAVFGLAPYFKDKFMSQLQEVPYYSVSFDESYNKFTKNEQMDLALRFWSKDEKLVTTRYLGSEFLGHATASDLLHHFNKGTAQLDCKKILQISMDGPNVNVKFYNDLLVQREALDPNLPSLLDIGSCGLHVVHGAFRTAFESTGWKIDAFLRSLWYLFHDSPARRADYKEITGSDVFPLQFCGTRWVEDSSIAERAVLCWDNICKYIRKVAKRSKSKIPKSASYETISKAVDDPLILAKLQVFIYVSKTLKPFLELFQSDAPMLPCRTYRRNDKKFW